MADRLQIYNDAMLICGQRALATLTDNTESRYLLDQVWNNNGVKTCLEEGQWFFAMRTQMIDYDPAIAPTFGYQRGFQKPTDWLRTCAMATDEFFCSPLLRVVDEAGFWYSDLDTIYVRFVSNDATYGMDLNRWPQSFAEFVAAHFASKVMLKLSNDSAKTDGVIKLRNTYLSKAKTASAMAEATKFPPPGSWIMGRIRGVNRRDGGGQSGPLY